MAPRASIDNPPHISAELREAITRLLKSRPGAASATLHELRLNLQRDGIALTQEGELLHPQDRTALLIEIDELIDRHGLETPAKRLLPADPA